MGEINLIPGQQVRGQRRSGQKSADDVEYTQPEEAKIPAPSLIPVPPQPPQESWWQKRKAAQAAKRLAAAKAQAVKIPAPPPPPAQPPAPLRPLAVDVNLLPHEAPPQKAHAVKIEPVPLHVQAEPDFLSDAGFKSNSSRNFPASEAYSIRRTKPQSHSATVKPKEHAKSKRQTHEPVEKPAELLDVNLIPKEFGQAERPKHAFIELVWYGLTAALIVGAVYGGLKWWEFNLTQRSSELRQQITLLDADIADFSAERAVASDLQEQLLGLNAVITQHVTYDQFFSFMEENTLPSVYYKSLNVDSRTGQVTATAVTADFNQLRAQEAVFQSSPLVQDVVVTSATRTVPTTPTVEGEEVVVENVSTPLLFNLSLSLDTSLFHP